jgi:undecaprenyl-diphosphatase
MDALIQFDQNLFLIINGLHSPFFDFLMYWFSDKYIWVPLYAFLLFLMFRENRNHFWLVLLMVALLVTLTDQISVKLFKDVFMRLRPCHEPALDGMVRTLYGQCGGMYGFVSSHATNTFGVAVFTGLVLTIRYKWIIPVMLAWAGLVSYSRIYLGVHYPGDVITGALTGAMTGYLVFLLFRMLKTRLRRKDPAS